MTLFDEYARYYDLFYAEKDYAAESAFVSKIVRRHVPGARSLLEFGCGSARHAFEFVRDGFAVTGVELSPGMIAHGKKQMTQLPVDLRAKLTLTQGDATQFAPTMTYDAVIALFHVVSYQTTNQALAGILRSARAALGQDGVFVFDFWYGPTVLKERPQVRVKRVETEDVCLTRIAEPVHVVNRNIVDVNYTLIVADRNGCGVREFKETHSMRYLFLPEIALLAGAASFEIAESGEWLTSGPLHDGCWAGYVALRPIGG
jgi:SAM-dependent methyltransferase